MVAFGDYVLATKWSDGDPNDPWGIGVVTYIGGEADAPGGLRYYLSISGDQHLSRTGFRRAVKITPEQGDWILSNKDEISSSGRSLWRWLNQCDRHLRGEVHPKTLIELAWELEGVVCDVKAGTGIDEVCMRTIMRVIDDLRTISADSQQISKNDHIDIG